MPLLEMNLTTLQLITGAIVALFYLPCLSFWSISKGISLKVALFIGLITTTSAFLLGGLFNQIGSIILGFVG